MKKTWSALVGAVALVVLGGCAQVTTHVPADAHCTHHTCIGTHHTTVTTVTSAPVVVAPCATDACKKKQYTYEVTRDSWCGSNCDAYPVSHRSRDTACEDSKVEYRHHQGRGPVAVTVCQNR